MADNDQLREDAHKAAENFAAVNPLRTGETTNWTTLAADLWQAKEKLVITKDSVQSIDYESFQKYLEHLNTALHARNRLSRNLDIAGLMTTPGWRGDHVGIQLYAKDRKTLDMVCESGRMFAIMGPFKTNPKVVVMTNACDR